MSILARDFIRIREIVFLSFKMVIFTFCLEWKLNL